MLYSKNIVFISNLKYANNLMILENLQPYKNLLEKKKNDHIPTCIPWWLHK